jgi:hypothetical protein
VCTQLDCITEDAQLWHSKGKQGALHDCGRNWYHEVLAGAEEGAILLEECAHQFLIQHPQLPLYHAHFIYSQAQYMEFKAYIHLHHPRFSHVYNSKQHQNSSV